MAISRALIEALLNGEVGTADGNSMMSDYQANPFYMQDKINKKSLDKILEETLKKKNQLAMEGMFTDSGGSNDQIPLDPSIEAFLDAESLSDQGARIKQDMPNMLNNSLMFGVVPAVFNQIGNTPDVMSPGMVAAQANIYGRTPSFLQSFLPDSYANSAGFMSQNDSIFGGYNPNGAVTMGPQQSAALAAQDMGLFDTPDERDSWYSSNSDSFGSTRDQSMQGSMGDTAND